MNRILPVATLCLITAVLPGCRVNVQKDTGGDEKKVQVDTPFGGVHVDTNAVAAKDLGLPAYPNATPSKDDGDKGDDQAADIHLGFGDWQFRLKVAGFDTKDSVDQVSDFYKKALTQYGDVITCHGTQAVGGPTVTRQGLSCADKDESTNETKGFHFNYNDANTIELKTGSKHHQRIVAISKKPDHTEFALVLIDLPSKLGKDKTSSSD